MDALDQGLWLQDGDSESIPFLLRRHSLDLEELLAVLDAGGMGRSILGQEFDPGISHRIDSLLKEYPWDSSSSHQESVHLYGLSIHVLAEIAPSLAIQSFCGHWNRLGARETVMALTAMCRAVVRSDARMDLDDVTRKLWKRHFAIQSEYPTPSGAGLLSKVVELMGYCDLPLDGPSGPLQDLSATPTLAASVLFLLAMQPATFLGGRSGIDGPTLSRRALDLLEREHHDMAAARLREAISLETAPIAAFPGMPPLPHGVDERVPKI